MKKKNASLIGFFEFRTLKILVQLKLFKSIS
jgi:hypothetical protein